MRKICRKATLSGNVDTFLYSGALYSLGAVFKVIVLIEGLTEVRPANAISMFSGYLFELFGALGCAAGNLIADCFGTRFS